MGRKKRKHKNRCNIQKIHKQSAIVDNCSEKHIKETSELVKNLIEHANDSMDTRLGYISDIHLEHHINQNTLQYSIEAIVKNILPDGLNTEYKHTFVFLGDTSNTIALSEMFYRCFAEQYKDLLKGSICFVILGNHELSEFDTIPDAYIAYDKMLNSIRITYSDGIIKCPFKLLKDSYDLGYIRIYGAIGLSQYNPIYNSMNTINAKKLTRDMEIVISSNFENRYLQEVNSAIVNNRRLIVCSHYPVSDWIKDSNMSQNCIYLCGHNHRNEIIYKDEYKVFADNQIGYESTKIQFKLLKINYKPAKVENPFKDYNDGCYSITSELYCKFLSSIEESPYLCKRLLCRLSSDDMFMIKSKGYYCFLLKDNSGRLRLITKRSYKNINKTVTMQDILDTIDTVINISINAYIPFYEKLKSVSDTVKNLGFNGTIHGCIIDIDFYNHIMINPYDGALTYYYSPIFGVVKSYDSLYKLICENTLPDRLKYVESKFKPIIDASKVLNDSNEKLLDRSDDLYHSIPIKGSIYEESRFMLKLQYLYEKKLLLFFNADVLVDKSLCHDLKNLLSMTGDKDILF